MSANQIFRSLRCLQRALLHLQSSLQGKLLWYDWYITMVFTSNRPIDNVYVMYADMIMTVKGLYQNAFSV